MCTLSWLYSQTGIEVFFNRDESKNRPRAIPPAEYTSPNGHQYLMPLDTQSNGSWIGVTESGFCLCILNYYQGETPTGELISRGLLVKTLLEISAEDAIYDYLDERDWKQYAPFTLVLFFPNTKEPTALCWDGIYRDGDGHALKPVAIHSPYTSSGVDFPAVSQARQTAYKESFNLLENDNISSNSTKLKSFHASHIPEKSKYSVCMHRSDASTVSFSRIEITSDLIEFEYADGAPCQVSEFNMTSLPKK